MQPTEQYRVFAEDQDKLFQSQSTLGGFAKYRVDYTFVGSQFT